jgi:RimJ/RimL family protein N-acetyltransferase|tara:strand:- start:7571 stop:8782 length:1212 start_codon:yes stop_codon:yes gene_type:complete
MRPKLDLSNVTYLSIIGNDSPKEYTDIDSIIKIGQYSSRNINFGRKVIYTHKEPSVDVGDFEIVKIDEVPYEEFSQFVIRNYGNFFETEYMLNFHGDGFIQNADAWDDAFFAYDYIGAPFDAGGELPICAGNGGFSLRSKRFCEKVRELYKRLDEADPVIMSPNGREMRNQQEDILVCGVFNHDLIFESGLLFADKFTCSSFSTEYLSAVYSDFINSFGFHEINSLHGENCSVNNGQGLPNIQAHRKQLYNYIFPEKLLGLQAMNADNLWFVNGVRNQCRQYLHDNNHYSLPQALEWFERESPEFFLLGFGGAPIGYFRTSQEDGRLYIGLDLHFKWRGKGLATPAYRMFLDKIKKDFNLKEAYLKVLSENQVALNLYKKLGFVEIKKEIIDNKESVEMRINL